MGRPKQSKKQPKKKQLKNKLQTTDTQNQPPSNLASWSYSLIPSMSTAMKTLASLSTATLQFVSDHKYQIMMLSIFALVAETLAAEDIFFMNPSERENSFMKYCFRNQNELFSFRFPTLIGKDGKDYTLPTIDKLAECGLGSEAHAPRELIKCLQKASSLFFTRDSASGASERLVEEISMKECLEGASNFMQMQFG